MHCIAAMAHSFNPYGIRPMSQTLEVSARIWTAEDLAARFGAIPMNRIRTDPPPGMGTIDDVVYLDDHEDRLYELIDGVLLEKDMGAYESYLALLIGTLLNEYVRQHNLGIVLGADGMMELFPDRIRIPDVSFISADRKPFEAIQKKPVPELFPDLAVEVVSTGNTRQEMEGKLHDYFNSGTRLVWLVYPKRRTVDVYTRPTAVRTLTEKESLDGGDVLPGFQLDIARLFARPDTEKD